VHAQDKLKNKTDQKKVERGLFGGAFKSGNPQSHELETVSPQSSVKDSERDTWKSRLSLEPAGNLLGRRA
jgi:hypothetical protein